MNRTILWGVLAIGLALVIAPFAIGLPGKASAGQKMIDGFRPIMQPQHVATTAMSYNDVFTPMGKDAPLLSAKNMATFQGYMQGFAAIGKQLPPATASQLTPMARDFGALLGTMQANVEVFSKVPAGLAFYKPLVTTMQANVDNYRQIDSLPNFRLFTWFFAVPGALLVLLSGFGLLGQGHSFTVRHHARPTPA